MRSAGTAILLSFFVPDGPHNRHVVLAAKERIVARRHGTLLRSGQAMLPDETTLCATCWMHGVFGAQLTIGNTSLHKLFSVSRDPYNITRASGLRILVDMGEGWRLLAVPSVFEMGLSDCRWIYRFGERTIAVHAVASGDDPAMQWRCRSTASPAGSSSSAISCWASASSITLAGSRSTPNAKRFTFRPDPDWLWGKRYPEAVYHLVTATPDAIEAVGGDELLYADAQTARRRLCGAADAGDARRCASPSSARLTDAAGSPIAWRANMKGVADADHAGRRRSASGRHVTRGLRIEGERSRCRGTRHDLSVARAQRDDSSHRAARARAIYRRGLGHARCLPGTGRVPARPRP